MRRAGDGIRRSGRCSRRRSRRWKGGPYETKAHHCRPAACPRCAACRRGAAGEGVAGRLPRGGAREYRRSMPSFRASGSTATSEGKNLSLEMKLAHGRIERLPELAAELVQWKPDVIVTAANVGGLAAKKATGTIPVVVVASHDGVKGAVCEPRPARRQSHRDREPRAGPRRQAVGVPQTGPPQAVVDYRPVQLDGSRRPRRRRCREVHREVPGISSADRRGRGPRQTSMPPLPRFCASVPTPS